MQVGRVLPHGKGSSQTLASTNIPSAKSLLPCILKADVRTAVREDDIENLQLWDVCDIAFENETIYGERSQPTRNWNPSDENRIAPP